MGGNDLLEISSPSCCVVATRHGGVWTSFVTRGRGRTNLYSGYAFCCTVLWLLLSRLFL